MEQRPVENGQLGAKKQFFSHFFDFFLDFFWRYQNYSYLCTRNQEMIDASLAQLVEHDTLNVGVQGSSPWGGTKEKDPIRIGSFSFFIFPGLVPPSEFPESARPRTNLPATPHRKKPEPHGSLKFRITGVPKSLPREKGNPCTDRRTSCTLYISCAARGFAQHARKRQPPQNLPEGLIIRIFLNNFVSGNEALDDRASGGLCADFSDML